MRDRITPALFRAADGVDDWRVMAYHAAAACFRTGTFAAGLALVDEIGRLAEAAGHHPDIDLRYSAVLVTLTSHDVGGLSERDVALARQISAAARDRGVPADPGAVQQVHVTIDVLASSAVLPFWRALLAYDEMETEGLVDPFGRGPVTWFQRMDESRPQRNRVRLDVIVPDDQAEARIAGALAAGGRVVTGEYAPSWWVLADPEGNEACVVTWMGRD